MFEWDEAKRAINLEKHRLDLADADLIFDGRPVVTALSKFPHEPRFVSTALIADRFYSVVWTWRGAARRLISFRRARDEEERAHRKAHG
jgi:hypothetical protein